MVLTFNDEVFKLIQSKLKKLDKLIHLEKSRSLNLKEYRQSLISSVVTGKVRVTEDML